jgi:hypothetical protein
MLLTYWKSRSETYSASVFDSSASLTGQNQVGQHARTGPHRQVRAWQYAAIVPGKNPADAGTRVVLASLLYRAAWHPDEVVLVWVTSWSAWPSGETWPLFRRLRQALRHDVPLEDAPAQSFEPGDEDDGLSMVLVSCLFLWDSWILSSTGSYIVQIATTNGGRLLS